MKKLLFILVLFSLLCVASQGFAFQRYHSRKNPYFQLGLNVGGGNTYQEAKANPKFLAGTRGFDFGLNLGGGFGLSDMFVFGGEVLALMQPQKVSDTFNLGKKRDRFIVNTSLLATMDLYLFGGFAIGAGAGMAFEYYHQGKSNTQKAESAIKVGFGGKGSVGYEGFIGTSYTLGGRFYYNYNYYNKGSHDSLGVQVYMRWY